MPRCDGFRDIVSVVSVVIGWWGTEGVVRQLFYSVVGRWCSGIYLDG